MTTALVTLIVLAIIATIVRELVYKRAITELQAVHDEEREEVLAAAEHALEALKEASLEMTFARLQVEKLNG